MVGYLKRTDYYNCDEVERNLGDCTWDAAWTPQFLQDVKESKFWSVSVWIKPTQASNGMPRFFFPAVRTLNLVRRLLSLSSSSWALNS